MGRRAEGRRTHGTPRHGDNKRTPERSRACDRLQGLKERGGRFDVAHRRSAVRARHARRELARLEGRLNARTNAPTAPTAPTDLTPLRTRIDDLVKESHRLSPLPATFESLRQRVDALDKGLIALRTEVAAVPKQLDASLNALKNAMVSRPRPLRSALPTSAGTSAPSCFVKGNIRRRATFFSLSSRTTRMMRGCGISPRWRTG